MFVASRESHFVCIQLSQYCGKAHALKKKKKVGREGAVTRKEIQVGARESESEREKGGGSQAEKQRERAGV